MRVLLPAAWLAVAFSLPAHAAGTYPIWAATPSAHQDTAAQEKFSRATQRRGLVPVRTVSIPQPPPPPTKAAYAAAVMLPVGSAPDVVAAAYTAAAEQAIRWGGAGLGPDELSDLFFRQAVALQRATLGPAVTPAGDIEPKAAKTAYLRSVAMGLTRVPDAYADDPLVAGCVRLAKEWQAARKPASLSVRARPTATVYIDNRPYPHPARARDLPMGEHLVRVEEVGRVPYAALVPVTEPEVTIDTPGMDILRFPASEAAAIARQETAPFALLAQLRLGDSAEIDLSLVESETGRTLTSTAVNVASDDETVFAAVLRLDEEAGRTHLETGRRSSALSALDLALPPPKKPDAPTFKDDPQGWAATHWPLLTAVGVAVGSAVVLGIVVAMDKDPAVTP